MIDRRSGIDSRSEAERRLIGERRSGVDRRTLDASQPSNDQLALFARRIRRVMRDERGRHLLGVAIGEGHFTIYPDVVRVIDRIEQLAGSEPNPLMQTAEASSNNPAK